jgi:hypothetical protein
MRVAVFVVSMLILVTTSEASKSCMSKIEARQHFGSAHLYWHGADHCWDATSISVPRQIVHKVERKISQPKWLASKWQDSKWQGSKWQDSMSRMTADDEPMQTSVQGPWTDRWVDIEPIQLPLAARWVDIAPVTPPLSKSAPDPELRMMVLVLVFIVIVLTLAMIEVLFRVARGADEEDQAVA